MKINKPPKKVQSKSMKREKNTKYLHIICFYPCETRDRKQFLRRFKLSNVDIFILFLARFLNAIFRVTFMFFAISNLRRLFILKCIETRQARRGVSNKKSSIFLILSNKHRMSPEVNFVPKSYNF